MYVWFTNLMIGLHLNLLGIIKLCHGLSMKMMQNGHLLNVPENQVLYTEFLFWKSWSHLLYAFYIEFCADFISVLILDQMFDVLLLSELKGEHICM